MRIVIWADNSAFRSRFFAFEDLVIIRIFRLAKRAPLKSGCRFLLK